MHHVGQREPLPAMKALLRDLENTTLIYPDDADIIILKRNLRVKIAQAKMAEASSWPPTSRKSKTV